MTKTNHNQFSPPAKFGGLFFTPQTPFLNARTHPGLFSTIASRLHAWRAQRAAAAELAGLSDRELADIGVTRQQIASVVRAKIK